MCSRKTFQGSTHPWVTYTKYILNDFTSCYKTRLLKLNLLPLMYMFELQDLLFTIKSIKSPTSQSITTSNSVPLALDQEPAINSYHLVTLTIHLVIPIFTVYHIYIWNSMPKYIILSAQNQYLWEHFKK